MSSSGQCFEQNVCGLVLFRAKCKPVEIESHFQKHYMVWMEIGEYQVGVFQGTIAGPILFIIVFNDLITLLITQ